MFKRQIAVTWISLTFVGVAIAGINVSKEEQKECALRDNIQVCEAVAARALKARDWETAADYFEKAVTAAGGSPNRIREEGRRAWTYGQQFEQAGKYSFAKKFYESGCTDTHFPSAEACAGLGRMSEKFGEDPINGYGRACSIGRIACDKVDRRRFAVGSGLSAEDRQDQQDAIRGAQEYAALQEQIRQNEEARRGSAWRAISQALQATGSSGSGSYGSSNSTAQVSRSGACAACQNDPEYLRLRRSAEQGSIRDTYLAAARLCECNLQAGGCGSSRSVLQKMIDDNRAEAAKLQSNAPIVSGK